MLERDVKIHKILRKQKHTNFHCLRSHNTDQLFFMRIFIYFSLIIIREMDIQVKFYLKGLCYNLGNDLKNVNSQIYAVVDY